MSSGPVAAPDVSLCEVTATSLESSWSIVGCGYVGSRLAARLLDRGASVRLSRRSLESCALLRETFPDAHVQESCLEDLESPTSSVVVVSAPPGPSSPSIEADLASRLPASTRLIYLSTTGVYAPGKGKEVSDDFEIAPPSARGQARLDVERALQSAHDGAIALRIPSIYGPGRGVHQRMRNKSYRLIGAADTSVSRIHVDDLVAAILILGDTLELPHQEYVVGDLHPTSAREHAAGIAQCLKVPMPPTVDPSEVSQSVNLMLAADRKIVAKRLSALGWSPQYPSWREGLKQVLQEQVAVVVR